MARNWADTQVLVGRQLGGATVGWHVHEGEESAVLLFVNAGGESFEVCTTGAGSLRLDGRPVPEPFDMDEYGRFELRPVGREHPLFPLLGSEVREVARLRSTGVLVGWRITTDRGIAVLANEGDEIFASTGALPPDFLDASVER